MSENPKRVTRKKRYYYPKIKDRHITTSEDLKFWFADVNDPDRRWRYITKQKRDTQNDGNNGVSNASDSNDNSCG